MKLPCQQDTPTTQCKRGSDTRGRWGPRSPLPSSHINGLAHELKTNSGRESRIPLLGPIYERDGSHE
jgi:hypothetical protein